MQSAGRTPRGKGRRLSLSSGVRAGAGPSAGEGAALPGEWRRAGGARQSHGGRNSGAGRAARASKRRLESGYPSHLARMWVVGDGGLAPHPLILPLLGGAFPTAPESPRAQEERWKVRAWSRSWAGGRGAPSRWRPLPPAAEKALPAAPNPRAPRDSGPRPPPPPGTPPLTAVSGTSGAQRPGLGG